MNENFFYADVCLALYRHRLCSASEVKEALKLLPESKSKTYLIHFLSYPPEERKKKTFSYSPPSDHSDDTIPFHNPDGIFSVE